MAETLYGGKRTNSGQAALRQDPGLPLISIITITFNAEEYLLPTLKSVQQQTYPNIEHVIIDGASEDRTVDILQEHDHAIGYWQSEPDGGLYDAMNKGIKASTGNYIWFINAGDRLHSHHTLSNLSEVLSTKPDVLYGETELIDANGQVLGTRSELTTRKLPAHLTWQSLKRGMVVSHQSFLVKQEICPFYLDHFQCSSDIDWMIKSLKKSTTVKQSPEPLSQYLVGGTSIQISDVCWRERFTIFVHHFGLLQTLAIHVFFIARILANRLSGKRLRD